MDLIDRLASLERARLFAFLQADCLASIALALEEESIPASQIIYGPGEAADCIYLLCEGGPVRLAFGGRIREVAPGECFGFEEVLAGCERRHGARCEGACLLLKLDRSRALNLLAEDSGLSRGAVAALLARQIEGA
jgi:NTE family protein